MKLIIAGGRDFPIDQAESLIRSALATHSLTDKVCEIVYGGCRGIDSAAYNIANGIWPTKLFPADWSTHGRAAGPIRNRQMAEYSDALLLIWDGKSRGSANMKAEMQRIGKQIYEVISEPRRSN